MLIASEVAVEYWLALSWSPQAQWLRESEQAGPLQEGARGSAGCRASEEWQLCMLGAAPASQGDASHGDCMRC